MTVIIGARVTANALLLALALSVGRQLFIDALAGTTFGPASRVFYTGKLRTGRHQVAVRTADQAGATTARFGWRVAPMPTKASPRQGTQHKPPCRSRPISPLRMKRSASYW